MNGSDKNDYRFIDFYPAFFVSTKVQIKRLLDKMLLTVTNSKAKKQFNIKFYQYYDRNIDPILIEKIIKNAVAISPKTHRNQMIFDQISLLFEKIYNVENQENDLPNNSKHSISILADFGEKILKKKPLNQKRINKNPIIKKSTSERYAVMRQTTFNKWRSFSNLVNLLHSNEVLKEKKIFLQRNLSQTMNFLADDISFYSRKVFLYNSREEDKIDRRMMRVCLDLTHIVNANNTDYMSFYKERHKGKNNSNYNKEHTAETNKLSYSSNPNDKNSEQSELDRQISTFKDSSLSPQESIQKLDRIVELILRDFEEMIKKSIDSELEKLDANAMRELKENISQWLNTYNKQYLNLFTEKMKEISPEYLYTEKFLIDMNHLLDIIDVALYQQFSEQCTVFPIYPSSISEARESGQTGNILTLFKTDKTISIKVNDNNELIVGPIIVRKCICKYKYTNEGIGDESFIETAESQDKVKSFLDSQKMTFSINSCLLNSKQEFKKEKNDEHEYYYASIEQIIIELPNELIFEDGSHEKTIFGKKPIYKQYNVHHCILVDKTFNIYLSNY
ncbi:hypothetical protein TRFO_09341 [Tritrichomonas foetus]|uniref:Uncharacterized protein n=1 Tax=Tritrichomonas foetus TaxID=1144522 RepID=A0A1J4JK47_9EUKA|nr:hypothetical protein TRFO_09341 [Tritrichomonas foetus]|eukprot:OHS97636.1 hypothetical protein TRFO_09341 [Tritrichomonas foetus]